MNFVFFELKKDMFFARGARLRGEDARVNVGLEENFECRLLVHVAAVEHANDAADFELEHGSRAEVDEGLQVDASCADAYAGRNDDHGRRVAHTELPGNFFLQAVHQPRSIERLRLAVFVHYAHDERGVFEGGGARSLDDVPNLREFSEGGRSGEAARSRDWDLPFEAER